MSAPFDADASPAHRRFNDLMWYAVNQIALTDLEIVEVQQLAEQLGIPLAWRRLLLGEFRDIEWKDGRANDYNQSE